MILGIHVSGAGKLHESPAVARGLGCDTMQIFARSPQRWRGDFIGKDEAGLFVKEKRKLRIDPLFIHISYLINLASPDPGLYSSSVDAYIEDMLEADILEADYIVTHMGSHKETSEEAGIERLIEALNRIIDKTQSAKVGILLENTTGSGSWLGYKFAHLKKILQGIKDKKRIGLCLDTAHAYLAGYDISTKTGLEKTLGEINEAGGLGILKLIHLNDAKGALGSKHDRHEHIGKGSIGLEGMKRIVNHPKLKNIPFILETPKEREGDEARNLNTVRKLAGIKTQ